MKSELTARRKGDKSDIRTDRRIVSFILQCVPAQYRDKALSFMVLSRFDRPVGVWLLLLPGLWSIWLAGLSLSRGLHSFDVSRAVWLSFLFCVGAFVMRSAGCVVNDIWDRDLDKKVERTRLRPLASGDLSLIQALIFLAILLAIGLAILLQMNMTTIVLGILSLPLVIVYPLMKRFTWWPQAFLGLTFNFGALMGWAAVSDSVALPALLLYCSGIFWTLGYDTIYAHQDIEDDILVGIKSTALKFGQNSKRWVAGFYIVSFGFMSLAVSMAFRDEWGILAAVPLCGHFVFQLIRWKPYDADSALRMFKANRDCGLLALFGIVTVGVFWLAF